MTGLCVRSDNSAVRRRRSAHAHDRDNRCGDHGAIGHSGRYRDGRSHGARLQVVGVGHRVAVDQDGVAEVWVGDCCLWGLPHEEPDEFSESRMSAVFGVFLAFCMSVASDAPSASRGEPEVCASREP